MLFVTLRGLSPAAPPAPMPPAESVSALVCGVARVTEPSYVAAVRESYDTVAADYVTLVKTPSEIDPLGRAMLAADRGPVADLGCGPGRVTAHLAALGLSTFGGDLSPKMIKLARQAYPSLRFTVGSMTALDLGDGELGGIQAWFSTYHTPPEYVPVVFAEFHRTPAPGGHLLLGVYVGDDEHRRGRTAVIRCPTSPIYCHQTALPHCWAKPDSSSPRDCCRSPTSGRRGRTPASWPANPNSRNRLQVIYGRAAVVL
jgi:SAM-dependent methyltransferase